MTEAEKSAIARVAASACDCEGGIVYQLTDGQELADIRLWPVLLRDVNGDMLFDASFTFHLDDVLASLKLALTDVHLTCYIDRVVVSVFSRDPQPSELYSLEVHYDGVDAPEGTVLVLPDGTILYDESSLDSPS